MYFFCCLACLSTALPFGAPDLTYREGYFGVPDAHNSPIGTPMLGPKRAPARGFGLKENHRFRDARNLALFGAFAHPGRTPAFTRASQG